MIEHPDHPRSDWQYEVTNGDTSLGYDEWLMNKLRLQEQDEFDRANEVAGRLRTLAVGTPDDALLREAADMVERMVDWATFGRPSERVEEDLSHT